MKIICRVTEHCEMHPNKKKHQDVGYTLLPEIYPTFVRRMRPFDQNSMWLYLMINPNVAIRQWRKIR